MDRSFEGSIELTNPQPRITVKHQQPRPILARIRAVDEQGETLAGTYVEDPPPVSMIEPAEQALPLDGAIVRFTSMEDTRTLRARGFTDRRVSLAQLGIPTPDHDEVIDVDVRLDRSPPLRVFASLDVRADVQWVRCHGPDGFSPPCDPGLVGYTCPCAEVDRVIAVLWRGQDEPQSYTMPSSPMRLAGPPPEEDL